MEIKWSGWVLLILSVCLGSYQGKARHGGKDSRRAQKTPQNPKTICSYGV